MNKTKDYGVRFTVQQAVIQMFQLTNIEFDPCFGFMLDGVAGACESEMLKDMDRQSESVSFMGYEYVNPFNVMSNNEATFPREAFYEWWKVNPHRIPCPEWFEDLRKADGACVLDGVESVDAVSLNVTGVNEASKAVGITGRLDKAIRLGRSTERVLELIQLWLDRPDERKGSETEWRKTLFDSIEFNAKKEGWGLHADGGLSEKQWKAIELIFLPEPTGSGRGSKSWGGKYSFDDLKAK